ncbi:transposase [Nostoc sp. CALU 546]|uniref:transposase n=1 Tax=Nostoc sp. CALU 546 TaxID=1867241 RepID=UPI003B670BAF
MFHLPGRQTQGFLEALFMIVSIELEVPDRSMMSRRLNKLSLELPIVPKNKVIHVVVDSTGVVVLNRMIQSDKPDNYKVED